MGGNFLPFQLIVCSFADESEQYDAFTYSTTFTQFASTASNGISLEQIHNVIHWDGACGNQLVDADLSAFDPLLYVFAVVQGWSSC